MYQKLFVSNIDRLRRNYKKIARNKTTVQICINRDHIDGKMVIEIYPTCTIPGSGYSSYRICKQIRVGRNFYYEFMYLVSGQSPNNLQIIRKEKNIGYVKLVVTRNFRDRKV